jgi:hypothetical protein
MLNDVSVFVLGRRVHYQSPSVVKFVGEQRDGEVLKGGIMSRRDHSVSS